MSVQLPHVQAVQRDTHSDQVLVCPQAPAEGHLPLPITKLPNVPPDVRLAQALLIVLDALLETHFLEESAEDAHLTALLALIIPLHPKIFAPNVHPVTLLTLEHALSALTICVKSAKIRTTVPLARKAMSQPLESAAPVPSSVKHALFLDNVSQVAV
jgi:hypothetical protein